MMMMMTMNKLKFLIFFLISFFSFNFIVKANYNDTSVIIDYNNTDFQQILSERETSNNLNKIKDLCALNFEEYILMINLGYNSSAIPYFCYNLTSSADKNYYYFNNKSSSYSKSLKTNPIQNLEMLMIYEDLETTFLTQSQNTFIFNTFNNIDLDLFYEIFYQNYNTFVPIFSTTSIFYTTQNDNTSKLYINNNLINDTEEIPLLYNKKIFDIPIPQGNSFIYLEYLKDYNTIKVDFDTIYNSCGYIYNEIEYNINCNTISINVISNGLYNFFIKNNENVVIAQNNINVLANINSPYVSISYTFNTFNNINEITLNSFNTNNFQYQINDELIIFTTEKTINFNLTYSAIIKCWIYDINDNLIFYTYTNIPKKNNINSENKITNLTDFINKNNTFNLIKDNPVFDLLTNLNLKIYNSNLKIFIDTLLVVGFVTMLISIFNRRKRK